MKSSVVLFLILTVCFSCSISKDSLETKNLPAQELVDKVYPLLDSENSRWFYFASACRPFGMVNLSPDTQLGGAWGSGYRYLTDTIKGFSHIHAWQMSGVSVMPIQYDKNPVKHFEDYYSSFDHDHEIAEVGYHKVILERYDIKAELSSTARVGFHRYTFNNHENNSGLIFKLNGLLGPCKLKHGSLELIDNYTIKGVTVNAPTRRRPKDLSVYFIAKLDQPIQDIITSADGNKILLFEKGIEALKMKVALSYTSHKNAMLNLEVECPDWDFETVVSQSKQEWNDLLGRIKISDTDSIKTRRFYTDLWHGLQGRRTISDINGAYPDNTGDEFRIGQIPLDPNNTPQFRHFNSDSFWGAQWTLNTLWGLVYPEIYSEFVHSLIQYYRDGGNVPRGPSGGNFTYVMTGASSTPFIVSAFQKGIDVGNSTEVYEALKKNHISGGIMSKAGYEHRSKLGGGLDHYIEKGYVPYPIPEGKFGFHQDGASLTLEYAYQDWTLAQMAKALDIQTDYDYFIERSKNYTNVFDAAVGWMRPKDIEGNWKDPYDPYQYENGFNESNGAQSTWFVGHDIDGLADLMGGKDNAANILNTQFKVAAKTNFTSGESHERGENPELARVPINYGNQPSIQTAFIFNYLDRPDLTQYWTSEINEKTFGGLSPKTGYNGDEDQGLMGSLAVIMKLGIFQMNGGTDKDATYDLSSPLFNKVTITLGNGNKLKFEKSGSGTYIDKVLFNNEAITDFKISHRALLSGGTLKFHMKNSKE